MNIVQDADRYVLWLVASLWLLRRDNLSLLYSKEEQGTFRMNLVNL